jgi:hypothetical protein
VPETTAFDSRCPRCGGGFHCGVNDAAPCACTGVRLDAATRTMLRERYTGCLCVRCLAELSVALQVAATRTSEPTTAPAPK